MEDGLRWVRGIGRGGSGGGVAGVGGAGGLVLFDVITISSEKINSRSTRTQFEM